MIQHSNANDSLGQSGIESGMVHDLKEQASDPIIIYGGQINDLKGAVPADDNKLISLEARLCGKY